MKLNLKNIIEEMIYDANGCESIMMPVLNVKNSKGEIYQVQINVTKQESELSETTCLPDMKIIDGHLEEDI